jgi:sigma-B regulation protein RsbU (phosphoserine phosphatase)
MKHSGQYGLRNAMLLGNAIANFIGIKIVNVLSRQSIGLQPWDISTLAGKIDAIFIPASFVCIGLITLVYEWPLRSYLRKSFRNEPVNSAMTLKAQRRLLNEPFVLIALDLIVWITASILYPIVFHFAGIEQGILIHNIIQTSLVGLITTIIAFFVLEHMLQKRLAPHVFPNGGLSAIPRTLRIRIRTRLTALFFACNLIPFLSVFLLISATRHAILRGAIAPERLLASLQSGIITNAVIFILVGLLVTMLVSVNLTRPIIRLSNVLQKIRNGHLDQKVQVTSNDEIGYTGDVVNEMAEGLKERAQMRRSLDLAREVQQRLLPMASPNFNGLDVAGRSVYCDQTGGDYFDYFDLNHMEPGSVGLLVGDVAGHGIPSALLMATARAFLRLRSNLPGSLAQVVCDVNHQLSMDLGETGQFMTLYYMVLNPARQSLRWVRAGHDAAILYDPHKDQFEELYGTGLALGVDAGFNYVEAAKEGLRAGQVIVLGTDGIWEARNRQGRMFGKKALYKVIRENHQASAGQIVAAVIDTLGRHQTGLAPEDDVTLVVLKLLPLS